MGQTLFLLLKQCESKKECFSLFKKTLQFIIIRGIGIWIILQGKVAGHLTKTKPISSFEWLTSCCPEMEASA